MMNVWEFKNLCTSRLAKSLLPAVDTPK